MRKRQNRAKTTKNEHGNGTNQIFIAGNGIFKQSSQICSNGPSRFSTCQEKPLDSSLRNWQKLPLTFQIYKIYPKPLNPLLTNKP